jgi:hypothetical protein
MGIFKSVKAPTVNVSALAESLTNLARVASLTVEYDLRGLILEVVESRHTE